MSKKTLSLVVPYRNWPVEIFEPALHSLQLQTVPIDEVIVVDIASGDPYRDQMKALCERYGSNYHYLPIDLPDKAIEVHLWNTCFNWGIRKAKGDLIACSGIDRVYENNMVECILDVCAWNSDEHLIRRGRSLKVKGGKETFFSTQVYNLFRTPKLSELTNFDALIEEATWRGGFGFWGTSREIFHKIQGFDETIRWFEDWDLAGRAKRVGATVTWISHGRPKGYKKKFTRVLHLADHPKSRKQHSGCDTDEVRRRGKEAINKKSTRTIENGKDWGLLTKEKLERVEFLLNLTEEDFANLRARGIEPLEYRRSY